MRGREITTQHVHKAESPEQIKRRERRTVLKGEFRKTAVNVSRWVFGGWKPQVDIIKDERYCTAEIVEEVTKISNASELDRMLEHFLKGIELESGRLENPDRILDGIKAYSGSLRKELTVCTIELLMATENEELVFNFMDHTQLINAEDASKMFDGIIKFSSIDYVHTMGVFAEGFVKNPFGAAKEIENIVSRIGIRPSMPEDVKKELLFSDLVTAEMIGYYF